MIDNVQHTHRHKTVCRERTFCYGEDCMQWLVHTIGNGHDAKEVQARARHVLNKAHKRDGFDGARCTSVQRLGAQVMSR